MTMQFKCQNNSTQAIHFRSIRPIDRTLSGTTTLDLSGPGSDGNEGVLCIARSPLSDCLVSHPGHSLAEVGSYPSAVMQLVYSSHLGKSKFDFLYSNLMILTWSFKNSKYTHLKMTINVKPSQIIIRN